MQPANLSNEERLFLLYDICDSKEELQQHIKTFLNIDLPDFTVDQDSTSNPMDFIWEIYECMKTGQGKTRHVVAANRNGAKTLAACIVRFYGMIHFRRSGTHLAATLDQSQSAIKYLDKFLQIPGVAEYITVTNTKNKKLENLPVNRFTKNTTCELRVVVATTKGVNSARSSLSMRDETDLLPKEIISESAYIQDPTQDEHKFLPIEIDLSSRKSNDGPMQEKIDEAEGPNPPEDLKLHKWSLVDWMQKCPEHVHKPELGQTPAWINSENLKTVWTQEEYDALGPTEKSLQITAMAYEGCKTCPAWTVCQGRSPKQKSQSTMLRNISFVSGLIKSVRDPDSIIAQALNWRPGSSSRVFKMFKKRVHFVSYNEFYKFITGFAPNHEVQTKEELYNLLLQGGWQIHYGVDWGYSPASATCIVGAYHRRSRKACILHVEAAQEMANPDWANYIVDNIWTRFPGDLVCPDMADPAAPTYFKKRSLPCLDSKPSKIETGVAQIRSLLYDVHSQETRMVILNDGEYGQNHLLAEAMEKWTHLKSPLGFNFDKFEDDDYCDFIDPTRYLLAPFVSEGKASLLASQNNIGGVPGKTRGYTPEELEEIKQKQQYVNHMREHILETAGVDIKSDAGESRKKKSGSLKFKF